MKSFIVNLILCFSLTLTIVSCSNFSSNKRDKSVDEKKFDLFYAQGTEKLIKKDYTDALRYFLEAYQLNTDDSKLLNNLGMTYFFKHKIIIAEKYLTKALKIDPKNSDARNNLASIYFLNGDLEKSKGEYQKVLDDLLYKDHYRVHYNLGLIAMREKNYDLALNEMGMASNQKEDYCAANFQKGRVYFIKRNYTNAVKSFLDAQKGTCVTEPLPHWNLALTYIEMNNYVQARKKLHNIIDNFSTSKFAAMANDQLRKISSLEMIEDKDELILKEKYFGKK